MKEEWLVTLNILRPCFNNTVSIIHFKFFPYNFITYLLHYSTDIVA